MKSRAALFYVVNNLIVLTQLEWIQGGFDTLIGLFDRMGIWTNVGKMVGISFFPFFSVWDQL